MAWELLVCRECGAERARPRTGAMALPCVCGGVKARYALHVGRRLLAPPIPGGLRHALSGPSGESRVLVHQPDTGARS